jgi:hypothetical protein
MGKPEAPEGEATASADKSALADERPSMKERRQLIKQYIDDLRGLLKRLRKKLH